MHLGPDALVPRILDPLRAPPRLASPWGSVPSNCAEEKMVAPSVESAKHEAQHTVTTQIEEKLTVAAMVSGRRFLMTLCLWWNCQVLTQAAQVTADSLWQRPHVQTCPQTIVFVLSDVERKEATGSKTLDNSRS